MAILLRRLINDHKVNCWLVNNRLDWWCLWRRRDAIKATRALPERALDGSLDNADFRMTQIRLCRTVEVDGVAVLSSILGSTWPTGRL